MGAEIKQPKLANRLNSFDFKFARNWKSFLDWYKFATSGTDDEVKWTLQKQFIQNLFEFTVPRIINWEQLWEDLEKWSKILLHKKSKDRSSKYKTKTILWSETQRQIENLLLSQVNSLSEERFVVGYVEDGNYIVDYNKTTYWKAQRIKDALIDASINDRDIKNITVIDLSRVIK